VNKTFRRLLPSHLSFRFVIGRRGLETKDCRGDQKEVMNFNFITICRHFLFLANVDPCLHTKIQVPSSLSPERRDLLKDSTQF
jgi:hypothetical protein